MISDYHALHDPKYPKNGNGWYVTNNAGFLVQRLTQEQAERFAGTLNLLVEMVKERDWKIESNSH